MLFVPAPKQHPGAASRLESIIITGSLSPVLQQSILACRHDFIFDADAQTPFHRALFLQVGLPYHYGGGSMSYRTRSRNWLISIALCGEVVGNRYHCHISCSGRLPAARVAGFAFMMRKYISSRIAYVQPGIDFIFYIFPYVSTWPAAIFSRSSNIYTAVYLL